MEDKPPLVFANRVILRFVRNLIGDDVVVTPDDYTSMRLVFRRLRGSWAGVAQGDLKHCRLISRVVQAWSNKCSKQRKVQVGH